jgi:Spy/CpxP family protein refolding chaperone
MSLNRVSWLALGITVLPLGCAKSGPESAPISTQSAPVVQAPVLSAPTSRSSAFAQRRMDHGPGRGGVTEMMLHAARELDLKDPQKSAIEKLQQQLAPDEKGPPNEFREYQVALAAGVRAGKIDPAKLAPLQANLEKAMQARKDKEAAALNGLYAALEPPQRKALVASVRAKQTEREAHAQEKKAEGAKPTPTDWNKRRLERMTKEMELDATQQKSVEALLAKGDQPPPATMDSMRDEMKKRTDALLTAFEADTFDATKMELSPMAPKKPGEATDKHVQQLSLLLPILKPEQREKLAVRLEKPPMARGPHPGWQHRWQAGYGIAGRPATACSLMSPNPIHPRPPPSSPLGCPPSLTLIHRKWRCWLPNVGTASSPQECQIIER